MVASQITLLTACSRSVAEILRLPKLIIIITVLKEIPLAGFRIPKPWILDSTDLNYLDSGISTAHLKKKYVDIYFLLATEVLGK